MEFRLTYDGPLLASGSDSRQEYARAADKHAIRREFHSQLKKLWYTNPGLRDSAVTSGTLNGQPVKPRIEALADNWTRDGFRYVPLVYEGSHTYCKINVLMLRGVKSGDIIQSSDLDNRLKTLFDTFSIHPHKQALGGAVPQTGEDPFFVLVSDDRLITHLAVESDVLLQPVNNCAEANAVRLVITCTIWPYRLSSLNAHFI